MRVALLSCNAQARNAIGNQVAEKVAFFQERGVEVRVFLQDVARLHPELRAVAEQVDQVAAHGPAWDYLTQSDLVIADYAQFHELLHFLPLLNGTKPRLILDYHGVTPAQYWEGPQCDLLQRSARDRGIVWCCDFALAHSEFAKEELRRATGYPAERIAVQSYPIDLTLFQPGSCPNLRDRHGLGRGPILLYVGRLAASKRVGLLLQALPLLPEAQALIVGDATDVYGEEARCCRELAERLGVAERVRFLGQVADRELVDLYRGADVLVIPSLHEGYCLPAIEAMACGLPVVAARTTALPETLGDAGLTFAPDDAGDLARKVALVLSEKPRAAPPSRKPRLRIALVAFRFGSQIIGGAETSLRTIAHALQQGGHAVEVFTTCTRHESAWNNDLPAGTVMLDGLTAHRFPIDPHNREAHHASVRRLLEADGRVDAGATQDYLRHSIHSSALIGELRRREAEFDAIITGPYLFGLTHDVAAAFPERTLLLPCFHDEPFVRLPCWLPTYGAVGGVLYHSPEEQDFAQRALGLNHPRAVEIGTVMDVASTSPALLPRSVDKARTIVYCGRFSRQKNLPLLLEFAERYERERPDRFRWIFLGEGEVSIPQATWAENWGRTTEEEKRRLLKDAAALVQLSTQESLSLVALESWTQGTPVIVHEKCAVLRGQIARAEGGRAIGDYASFAAALDDLWKRPSDWQALGRNGHAYVARRYGSQASYRATLAGAVANLRIPLAKMMRTSGLARAAERSRPRWRERFGQFVELTLDESPTPRRINIEVRPQTTIFEVRQGSRAHLVPVRVVNHGTMPALTDGPAATQLVAEIVENDTGKRICVSRSTLPGLLAPGQSLPAAIVMTLPEQAGEYQVRLRAEGSKLDDLMPRDNIMSLRVGAAQTSSPLSPAGSFQETIAIALAEAHRLQRLPDDYVDVTEGRFARWKRWLKKKLLGNFKKAYVDVLSHQQSQVNQHLLVAVQQLSEYCATLEHALQAQGERRGVSPPCAVPTAPTAPIDSATSVYSVKVDDLTKDAVTAG